LDTKGVNNLYNQVFKTWIEPAIVKKIKSEKLDSYTIPSVMAVVFPHKNGKIPYVLLGKEYGRVLTKNVAKKGYSQSKGYNQRRWTTN